jgi:hypothetical protein
MSTGIWAVMALLRMRIRRKKHAKQMTDQRRMWRAEGIVGDVDGNEWEYGDDTARDEETYAFQADDETMQNLQD